ncbi:hypothetical protein LCGC14_2115590, partial [marine sediment metagenome]
RKAAVSQNPSESIALSMSEFRALPQIYDPAVAARLGMHPTQILGLPEPWIERMASVIIQGSGKIGL